MSTTETLTLTDFLLARIAEDEAVARDALKPEFGGDNPNFYNDLSAHADDQNLWTFHVPVERFLAECKARRLIVEGCREAADAHRNIGAIEWGGDVRGAAERASYSAMHRVWLLAVAHLALPYAAHPDYDEAWRP